MQIRGKVWKFGKNIDTDAIIPARYCHTADPVAGILTNHTQNIAFQLEPFPEFLQDMIKLGGLRYWVEDRLKSNLKPQIQNSQRALCLKSKMEISHDCL